MPSSAALPLIAVSANIFPAEDRRFYKNKPLYVAEGLIVDRVAQAGGAPVVLPAIDSPALVEVWADHIQGLVLSGGADVSPGTYGEAPAHPDWAGQPARDAFELALYRACRSRGVPVLGICRGCQLINVAEGGSLWQDLTTMREGSLLHRSQELYDALGHRVTVEPRSLLGRVIGAAEVSVNSIHHQAIKQLAPALEAAAFAPDGVIEGVVHRQTEDVLAVQWHPEWMDGVDHAQSIFAWIVEKARSYQAHAAG
jgi:putative glutamine amidotransferase